MRETIRAYIKSLRLDKKRRQRLISLICALSFIVAASVTWSLHIVGITMSRGAVSDPAADVENPSEWEATLPETASLTGLWGEDLIAVARSQLSYKESELNYIIDTETGEKKGYTRYGAWAGDIYADWSALFVSFCLSYANVPEVAFPESPFAEREPVNLDGKLKNSEIYETPDYIPSPGDLIFLDKDGDGVADAMGVVTAYEAAAEPVGRAVAPVREIPAETETPDEPGFVITVIEGDCGNEVAETNYSPEDAVILGYANIGKAREAYAPVNADEVGVETTKIPVTGVNKITVSINYGAAAKQDVVVTLNGGSSSASTVTLNSDNLTGTFDNLTTGTTYSLEYSNTYAVTNDKDYFIAYNTAVDSTAKTCTVSLSVLPLEIKEYTEQHCAHHKRIDFLGDSGNNPDTAIDDTNPTTNNTNDYRLYLDIKGKSEGEGEALDVLFIVDRSASMGSSASDPGNPGFDIEVDENYPGEKKQCKSGDNNGKWFIRRIWAVDDFLKGVGDEPGFISNCIRRKS